MNSSLQRGRARPHRCWFVPPHIVESIVRRGNDDQRDRAFRTLQNDMSFRTLRTGSSGQRLGARPFLSRNRQRLIAGLGAGAAGPPRLTIYSADHRLRVPGRLIWRQGDEEIGDRAVREARDYLDATVRFYSDVFRRDSIDNAGSPLSGTVHFARDYDNAFWNGAEMVFGDGDRELFNRFTVSVDIIGHELSHGVTDDESSLIYWGETGALNESISDVFGSLVKQYHLDQDVRDADWLVGEGLFTEEVNGVALRSMKAPGTAYDDPVLGVDPQPAHMKDYQRVFTDNGGVHINSGIPNHAFYLAAVDIGGKAWETTGLVWYLALLSPRLRPTSGFREFADSTVSIAEQRYGVTSDEAVAIRGAWTEVGVL